jgi:hypothetical protein
VSQQVWHDKDPCSKALSADSEKSHAHLQCVHNSCASFEESQPKGVGGVDYTKDIQYLLEK